MPTNYTTTQLVEALRYCVDAQRATSGEACRTCKAAALFGCDPLKACSKLNEVAADYILAMAAAIKDMVEERCDVCVHNIDAYVGCDIECEACTQRCACYDCNRSDRDRFEYRGPQQEDANG